MRRRACICSYVIRHVTTWFCRIYRPKADTYAYEICTRLRRALFVDMLSAASELCDTFSQGCFTGTGGIVCISSVPVNDPDRWAQLKKAQLNVKCLHVYRDVIHVIMHNKAVGHIYVKRWYLGYGSVIIYHTILRGVTSLPCPGCLLLANTTT